MKLYCRSVLPFVVVVYGVVILFASERIRQKQTDDLTMDTSFRSIQLTALHDRKGTQSAFPANNNETLTPSLEESFSACLLTMDDNHFLIEWLAYHYHTLPLRRLIVAVDPNSMTSPTPIFDRWRKQGMIIDEWSDTDYMPPTAIAESKRTFLNLAAMSDETRLHHYRQRIFYTKCLHTLQQENRTAWTLFIDSDEYLALNQRRRQFEESLPSMKQPGSILTSIQLVQNETPCIMVPRLRFGAIQSEPESMVDGSIPSTLNASVFTTLSFHKHAGRDDFTINKIGKAILDVSQVANETCRVRDPHRLVWEVCPNNLRIPNKESNLVIHHYLGTWEQFNFRNDARKGDVLDNKVKTFEALKNVHAGNDHSIEPWLEGFVKSVGIDTAVKLLEGVGDIHRWPINYTDVDPTEISLSRSESLV